MSAPDVCVGFADCPCGKCRASRREATAAHPDHGHPSDKSYCGACRTAEARRLHDIRRRPIAPGRAWDWTR